MTIRRVTSGADGLLLDSQEAFSDVESINYKIKWVNKLPTKRSQDLKDKMQYCYGLTRMIAQERGGRQLQQSLLTNDGN